MKIDKQLVHSHFSRHAHEYDRFASVQKQMAQTLQQIVASKCDVDAVESILEIGSGTGYLSDLLLDAFPQAAFFGLDLCQRMHEEAKKRIFRHSHRIEHVCADVESWIQTSTNSFDMIVSNATVQWLNQPFQTWLSAKSRLRAGGTLAFSTFLQGTLNELHQSFRTAEQRLSTTHTPRGQTFLGGANWMEFLRANSSEYEWREQTYVFEFPSVLAFLDTVRRIGAANAVADPAKPNYLNRQLLKTMVEVYETDYPALELREQGAVRATYVVGYGLFRAD